jgi:hypothetical protein
VAYTYGLILTDKKKYAQKITAQIEKIKKSFQTPEDNQYYWYWDTTSDKALFASILMSLNADPVTITGLIKELSDKDYLSYYISTQSKNAVFGTFIKYIEKYGKNTNTPVQITLNNISQKVTLTGDGNIFAKNVALSTVVKDGKVTLSVKNTTKTPVFVNVRMNAYPLDIKKVEKYENGIQLSRTIQEVVDTKKLAECSDYYYYSKNKDCESAFKTVDGVLFKK